MKITKELLKKLVREAYEEEMGSEGESGEGYEALLKDIGDKLKEAADTAKSLGKDAEYSDLRSMMVTIDELTRMHKQNSDEDFGDDEPEEDEGMLKESVKRRFARLANIRLNEGMEEAPKEEPLEASYPVDYGFGTNKRGIWLTVDDGGKLFVQFGGRIPAEKFFGKDLKPQDFQLKNDGDQHQISDNPMFRPSGDPLKSAQEERYRVLKKGKK